MRDLIFSCAVPRSQASFPCPPVCKTHFVLAYQMAGAAFAEKAPQFLSSCYSNRSSGDRWGFGNEVTQLSFGGTRGALGMEGYERLLRISDRPGSLWQRCCQDEKLALQSVRIHKCSCLPMSHRKVNLNFLIQSKSFIKSLRIRILYLPSSLVQR